MQARSCKGGTTLLQYLVLLAILLSASFSFAQTSMNAFDDPALEARYHELLESIRCMKCQNMSVAESPAGLAQDIKIIVQEEIRDGATDQEIIDFLIARYGAFISYKPPFQPSTWLLWFAPLLLAIAGGAMFFRILKVRLQQPLDEEEGA